VNVSDTKPLANDRLDLRAGDWVEVRSVEEILATLDDLGSLDGLPFMPEMLQYCGRRFQVFKSAHKTCDTIATYRNRRMNNAVHLEGLRCDGAARRMSGGMFVVLEGSMAETGARSGVDGRAH